MVPSPLGIHGEASFPCRALLVVLNSVVGLGSTPQKPRGPGSIAEGTLVQATLIMATTETAQD